MKKTIIFQLLFLLSISVFTQTKCFEGYKVDDYPLNPMDLENSIKYRQQTFSEIIKNCKAPNFIATTLKGDTVKLTNLIGKIVILNFWYIECAPCIAELPALNKLVDEYNKKDVVFLAPSRNSIEEINNKFIPNHIFKFFILPNCGSPEIDGSLANMYKMYFGWPTTYVLDKKGCVKFVKHGGTTTEKAKTEMYEVLKPIIDELLSK